MTTAMRQREVDVESIKCAARGRWLEILVQLGGVQAEFLDGKHHPCPRCGGTDRFRCIDDDNGVLFCNQCFREKNGDGVSALMWLNGTNFQETLRELAKWLNLDGGNRTNSSDSKERHIGATYNYHDADGNLLYQSVRFEPKDFRQRRPDGNGGWLYNLKGVERALYRLPELLNSSELVFFAEGEKDVDLLVDKGLTATTSGSANSWRDCYAVHFKNREVVVLPDADDPGQKFAETVAKSLHKVAKSVKVVCLPDLPEGGDVSDWLDAGGTIDELMTIVEQSEVWSPDDAIDDLKFKPFPLDTLPPTMRQYVKETANALGCDPAFVSVPLLPVLASAVGGVARIELNSTWVEHASIWGMVVADSGTMKSPGFHTAVDLLRPIEKEYYQEFDQDEADFERDSAIYLADMAEWKRKGRRDGEPPPDKPDEPVLKRLTINDATTEAVLSVLHENPFGVLVAVDELSGWLASLDAYKSAVGKDVSTWLDIYNGKPVSIDRKTGKKHTRIERPIVSIGGTCQPGVLRLSLLGRGGDVGEYIENGLAARFLFAMPPTKKKRWRDTTVDEMTVKKAQFVVRALIGLRDTQIEPIVFKLQGDALAAWVEFYNAHAAELESATGPIRAAWAKLEATAARLALVIHMVRCVEFGETRPMDRQSIEAGVKLARWFGHEARRLYQIVAENADTTIDTERRDLVELIIEMGGRLKPRDLAHKKAKYRKAGAAEAALSALVADGYGSWEHERDSENGMGRQPTYFALNSNRSA